jgi:hypothetical protein
MITYSRGSHMPRWRGLSDGLHIGDQGTLRVPLGTSASIPPSGFLLKQ